MVNERLFLWNANKTISIQSFSLHLFFWFCDCIQNRITHFMCAWKYRRVHARAERKGENLSRSLTHCDTLHGEEEREKKNCATKCDKNLETSFRLSQSVMQKILFTSNIFSTILWGFSLLGPIHTFHTYLVRFIRLLKCVCVCGIQRNIIQWEIHE